jgi:hypothetical protein
MWRHLCFITEIIMSKREIQTANIKSQVISHAIQQSRINYMLQLNVHIQFYNVIIIIIIYIVH